MKRLVGAVSVIVKEKNGSKTVYPAQMVANILDACRIELANNFSMPSKDIIAVYADKLGMSHSVFKAMLHAD